MKHIRPYPQVVGASTWACCPYCGARSDDICWVEGPIQHGRHRLICVGCCEDIYSTCASEDFETHPYYQIVVEAAKREDMSVREYRMACLQQQIASAHERRKREGISKYDERAIRLQALLDAISSE